MQRLGDHLMFFDWPIGVLSLVAAAAVGAVWGLISAVRAERRDGGA